MPVMQLYGPAILLAAQRSLPGTALGLQGSCCLRQRAAPLAAWMRSRAVLQASLCGSLG